MTDALLEPTLLTEASAQLLDIVLPVRPGERNEELRFALRSLDTNYPHARVWIVGHKPAWVTNVCYLPGNNAPHKRANLYHNLLSVCRLNDLSDNIVVTNDDIYVTQPIEHIESLYRGPLKEHIAMRRVQRGSPWWRESLTTTLTILQALGDTDPLSYELHTPFICNKHLMAETLERFAHITPENPPQWRTLYGNLHQIGGKQAADGKAYTAGPINEPYHSTEDRGWRYFAPLFAELFPEPSRYEKPL